jgi:hypothetical protein
MLNERNGGTRKLITRIMGGLGNQLFCYAAARRLALVNDAELVIDDVTGFLRDQHYRRRYCLDNFHIPSRKATPAERLEPFERYRRGLMKWWSRKKSFAERRYVEQEGHDFDHRVLTLKVNGTVYLDGVWPSEGYFKDTERTIRDDLRIIPPNDPVNQSVAEDIRNNNSVALHVRWFDGPGTGHSQHVSDDYYHRAIAMIDRKVQSPRYFLFSDEPDAARAKLGLPEDRVTLVSHNSGDENAYADLWLMTQCRHFITANSTFSWWGAWLGQGTDKIVITPKHEIRDGKLLAWGASVQIPSGWLEI